MTSFCYVLLVCRYMGCGPISTDLLKGLDVVDLGSGYARNTYAYGRLVGETGTSIGVELTEKEVRTGKI